MKNHISIKDGFNFLNKSKIKAGDGLSEGDFPFYTSSSIQSKFLNDYEIEDESLIFGTGGSASIHYSKGKFSTSTDCFIIQSNNKYEIDLKYVYFYLFGNIHLLENGFKGAGLKHISKKYLEEIKIPLLPFETQKKIVEALDKAQALIDARKEQIRFMDELVKSRFVELFGDPVINSKGYLKKALIEECEIITGNTPPRQKPQYYGNYIEWIKSDNINTPSAYLTKASEYLSTEGLRVGRYVEAGSILMTCIAGSLSCIGNIAIADRRVSFNQQINAIVPQKNNLWFMYVQFLLSKPYIQSTINMALKGILSKGQLSELKFIFPPLEQQNEFGDFVEKIEKAKLVIQSSLNEMDETYVALVQHYFG